MREAPGEAEKEVKVLQEAVQDHQEATDLQEPEALSQKVVTFPESLPLSLTQLQSPRPRSER